MFRTLRLLARAVLISFSILGALVALVLTWALTFWNQPLRRRFQHRVFILWSHAALAILRVKVNIIGQRPKDGVLLVTNHLSYTDIPLIAHVLPPRFVAKAEIRSWPFVGWCCRGVETIFINRSSRKDTVRVGEEIRIGLERGDNVVLFPEGTSGPGHGLLPFKPSLLAPAAAAMVPVHYAALSYKTQPPDLPAFRSVSWWGNEGFGSHAKRLLALENFEATIRFGDQPIQHADRKQLAHELRHAIDTIFQPMVDFEPHSPERPIPKESVSHPTLESHQTPEQPSAGAPNS